MSDYLGIRTTLISFVKDDASILIKYTPSIRANNTVYAQNARIKPVTYTGHTYIASTGGTSAGTIPTFNENAGATTTDGTVVWTEDSDDFDKAVLTALSIYSLHFPDLYLSAITGNETQTYALPSQWVNGFSLIKSIEYPVNNIPADLLESDRYEIYLNSSNVYKLRLLENSPTASETFNVLISIPRTALTIMSNHESAFIWLAAAVCYVMLSNKYSHTSDGSLNLDTTDYTSKAETYAAKSVALMDLYKAMVGIDDSVAIPLQAAVMSSYTYPYGIDRLTHSRNLRLTR